jgi:hypothetical protein
MTNQSALFRAIEAMHTTHRRAFFSASDYDERWAAMMDIQFEIRNLELCLDELRESLRQERLGTEIIDSGVLSQ